MSENEQKSFIVEMAELVDRHLSRRKGKVKNSAEPSRIGRSLRWFIPNGGTLLLIAALLFTQNAWARPAAAPAEPGPSATTVNYQGRLADSGGSPLDGSYGMSFSLWDAASDGSLVWGPESHAAVPVSEGLFSVGLGSQTAGGIPTTTWDGDRYLEITVGGETLEPRELIRSVPIAGMALTALTVPDGAIGTDQIADGGVGSNDLNLDYGKVCLSESVHVNLPGNYEVIDVPGLSLNFSLEKPSQVLVWIDGLARFNQASAEHNVILYVDDSNETTSFGHDTNWYSLKGQRILSLDSGSHLLSAKARSITAGTMTVHGAEHYYTCINYLVLGEQ